MKLRTSGFIVADSIVGMAILALVAGMLAVATHRQQIVMMRLANQRAALREAENVLFYLRAGTAAPDANVHAVLTPVDGGEAPAGKQWVRVDVKLNGETESLVGLVAVGEKGSRR